MVAKGCLPRVVPPGARNIKTTRLAWVSAKCSTIIGTRLSEAPVAERHFPPALQRRRFHGRLQNLSAEQRRPNRIGVDVEFSNDDEALASAVSNLSDGAQAEV